MAADERDVVAGRIQLDTSRVFSSFKQMDQAVRSSAAGYEVLNKQLNQAAKYQEALARASTKAALSSEELRQKQLAESQALVAQRNAQSALLTAAALRRKALLS